MTIPQQWQTATPSLTKVTFTIGPMPRFGGCESGIAGNIQFTQPFEDQLIAQGWKRPMPHATVRIVGGE